jgi:general secretion pathway protein I
VKSFWHMDHGTAGPRLEPCIERNPLHVGAVGLDLASSRHAHRGLSELRPYTHSPHARRRAGLTLIEVLVALAIFMMMAVVMGMSYINILNAYDIAARSVVADDDVRFARAALLAEADRELVERGGEFEGAAGRRVSWKAVVEPTNVADLFAVTFTCEITVPSEPKPEIVEERFRVLRPTWSEPAERDKLRSEAKTRIQELRQKLANSR